MILVPLPPKSCRLKEPLSFSIYNARGHLLVHKGTVIESDEDRRQLLSHGCFVDRVEFVLQERAFAEKLGGMLRRNASLKELAEIQPDLDVTSPSLTSLVPTDPISAWQILESQVAQVLRSDFSESWLQRFHQLLLDFQAMSERDPDACLFLSIQSLRDPVHRYALVHSLQVALICDLLARQGLDWSDDVRRSLVAAALTMNISIMGLQNKMALQSHPPTPEQRAALQQHPHQSMLMLRSYGVDDELCLQAVALHHKTSAGALQDRSWPEKLARVIQRADVFAARMSPRAGRRGLSATAAAQAIYTDEQKNPDEAGAAILKAVGLYPPGSFVRLKNGEVAVVIKRGKMANEPVVVSVVSRDGMPIGTPVLRDTRNHMYATSGGVPAHEVKVLINPLQILKMRSLC